MLRDYQQEMIERLWKAWRRYRSVMVQMPTGTGKTVLMAEVVREAQRQGLHVLVVAHRRELIEQISREVTSSDVVTSSDSPCRRWTALSEVRVESVQKISLEVREVTSSDPSCRRGTLGEWGPDIVIIDEAHHALAKTYRGLWERWPKAKVLGLTATPCRLNGAGFTDLFQSLLQGQTIQWFIDKGWLSDFEYISAAPDSRMLREVAGLKKRGADGDFQTKEMVTVMDVPESIAHLYETYRVFANGRKGIVYAIDRQHAQHIAAYYRERGVKGAVIDAKTPAKEREALVEDYREGRLDVLVNVDIFSEGFDCPEVEFIQLARPTLSLAKYLQQVGRGMRVSAGKPHVLILDNVGLYQTFGLPTEERDWRSMFLGREAGRGLKGLTRFVVLDDERQEKELVNLEMVRIKKGGRKRSGLEIYLKDGRYGIINGGRITCQARFKRMVRLGKKTGFFAAGIYGAMLEGSYVEYASLIDRKGADMGLKLFRDLEWKNGYFFSSYEARGARYTRYWDPKGLCYYDFDPEFQTVSGVEVAYTHEHANDNSICLKLRYGTGSVSPRFASWEMYYNRHVIIARDYLIVKNDHNHAYHICGYQDDRVIVQNDSPYEYLAITMDGKKREKLAWLPPGMRRMAHPTTLGLRKAAMRGE